MVEFDGEKIYISRYLLGVGSRCIGKRDLISA